MANQVKLRRDTRVDLEATTPVEAEPGYDQTNKRLIVGDGSKAGGIPHASYTDVQQQRFTAVDAGGTADAITLTLDDPPAAYAAYQRFAFKAASDNTGTATLNVNSLGAKTIKKRTAGGKANLDAGDIKAGLIYAATYDGTDFQLDGASSSSVGLRSIQVFTSSGTWNRPAGVTKVRVRLVGGGGGGGESTGGGGGGYAEKVIDVSAVSSVSVTVGSGGSGSSPTGSAPSGGTSSFGAYCSGTGGSGGTYTGTGVSGGSGVGGDLNIDGESVYSTVVGGDSVLGFGGDGRAATGYGGGGGSTASGSGGIVIVEEY